LMLADDEVCALFPWLLRELPLRGIPCRRNREGGT